MEETGQKCSIVQKEERKVGNQHTQITFIVRALQTLAIQMESGIGDILVQGMVMNGLKLTHLGMTI